MTLSDQELEGLEKRYFQNIVQIFERNKEKVKERLESRNQIKSDWIGKLKRTKREPTIVQIGAQRLTWSLILKETGWEINSAPVGSNLCFETKEAMIHIDDKSNFITDTDAKRKRITVLSRQISYEQADPIKGRRGKRKGQKGYFQADLPWYYAHRKYGEIPCLTFFIQFIYDQSLDVVKRILLWCVPNGQLKDYYGNIFEAPKDWKVEKGRLKNVRVISREIKEPRLIKDWKRVHEILLEES